MKVRLYFDEDSMSRALTRDLEARGFDLETALEAGMIERTDSEHLQYATRQGRVLFSCNVGDFCRLHKETLEQGRSHAGIIVEHQQRRSVGSQTRALLALMNALSAEKMVNRLEFLTSWD